MLDVAAGDQGIGLSSTLLQSWFVGALLQVEFTSAALDVGFGVLVSCSSTWVMSLRTPCLRRTRWLLVRERFDRCSVLSGGCGDAGYFEYVQRADGSVEPRRDRHRYAWRRGAHCGEDFSGKALTKVDRFVAYICTEMTKSVVCIGLKKCGMVQLSYAIGVLKSDDLDAGVGDQGITFWYAS